MDQEKKEVCTLAILVNNKSGVLGRIVGLFSRRGYNIDALSVGETENPLISRITIVVTGNRAVIEQIKRQVEKVFDVIKVYEMTQKGSLQRELILVKIRTTTENRGQVVEVGEIFKAKIIDVTPDTLTMQITGHLDKIESFLQLMKPYGIVELVRTGITALERGSRALAEINFDEE